jgi:hypothetical protein
MPLVETNTTKNWYLSSDLDRNYESNEYLRVFTRFIVITPHLVFSMESPTTMESPSYDIEKSSLAFETFRQ